MKIEGEILGVEDDQIVTVDAEASDTVEDIIIKGTLTISNFDSSKTSLYYNNRKLEKD